MRTFFAALIAAAAIAAPTSALAAKPIPDLVLSVTPVSAVPGAGCLYSVTASWDGARVGFVGFAIWDSSGVNAGFVDQGSVEVTPRPTRSGSVTWNSADFAVSGPVTVEAAIFDHRGFEIGRTSLATTC